MKRILTLSAIAAVLSAPLAIGLMAFRCDSASAGCGSCYNTGRRGSLYTDHRGHQQCAPCE